MGWFRQILVLSRLSLRTLSQRVANSLVTIIGVACVVGVFVAVLSLANGLRYTLASVGNEGNALILARGAATELNSAVSMEQERIIAELGGIRRAAEGQPFISSELYLAVPVADSSVTLRGLAAGGLRVRPNASVVEGRAFREGTNEVVVGRQIRALLGGAALGSTLQIGDAPWQVVGILEDDGSVSESEIWCDVHVLQARFKRTGAYQSVKMSLEPGYTAADIQSQMDRDVRLRRVIAYDEREYYASQSSGMSSFIEAIGYPLTLVMVLGAVIAVINTMYASVASRTVEIATLRAIGYVPFSVGVATLFESMLLALVGGAVGALAVYGLLSGYSVKALSSVTQTQVIFGFTVTPDLVIAGLVAALSIGLLGGLLPAVRASRLPVPAGLRED